MKYPLGGLSGTGFCGNLSLSESPTIPLVLAAAGGAVMASAEGDDVGGVASGGGGSGSDGDGDDESPSGSFRSKGVWVGRSSSGRSESRT